MREQVQNAAAVQRIPPSPTGTPSNADAPNSSSSSNGSGEDHVALLEAHRAHHEQQAAATGALRDAQAAQGTTQTQHALILQQLQREGSMFQHDFKEIVRQVVTVQVRVNGVGYGLQLHDASRCRQGMLTPSTCTDTRLWVLRRP